MSSKAKKIHQRKGKKGNILLVSDLKRINDSIGNDFSQNGYNIIVAENGLIALEKIRTLDIDIIITRLNMPSMDGLELLMNLKDLNIDSPVIILEEDNNKQRATYVKVLGYCCKPNIKKKMIEAINMLSP